MTLLDSTLLTLARDQHALLTTRQVEGLGVSRLVLSGWCEAGLLTRQLRGVYAVTSLLEPASGPDAAEQEHLLRCRAALLIYPDAALAGVSAVLAHALPVWGCDLTMPIIRRRVNRGRGVTGLHVRRPARATVDTAYGSAVTVPTALAELAMDNGIVPGVVSADHALHTGAVTAEALTEHIDALGVRWSSRPKAMAKLMDGRSESVGESRLRCILAFEGWALEPQVEVADDRGHAFARVDGILKGTRVVLEFDGKVKYADGDPATLIAEKKREDRLRALGWIVVRVEWADLEHPARLFAKIRRALAASAA
jgi:hypothetical protein